MSKRTSGYWIEQLVDLWNREAEAVDAARIAAELSARRRTQKRQAEIIEQLDEDRREPVLAAAKAMWSAQVKGERAKEDRDGNV